MDNINILYAPGEEPAELKLKLDELFSRLDAAWPDKVIVWADWDHAAWDRLATRLCAGLGYPYGAMFLTAYGYSILTDNGLIEPAHSRAKPDSNAVEPEDDAVEPARNTVESTRNTVDSVRNTVETVNVPVESARSTVDSTPTSETARLDRDEQGMSVPEARQQGDEPENGAADACLTAPEQTARLDRDEHEFPREAVFAPQCAVDEQDANVARPDRDEPSAPTPFKANEYRTGKVVRVLPYGNSGFVRDDKTGMDYYFNVRNFTHWVDDLRIGLAVSYRVEAHFVRKRNSFRDNAVDLTCLHHQGIPGLNAAK